MRVLLIGTSNAIYQDGYAGGIRDHAAVTKFEKYAIGASPSVIVPYLGSPLNFADYDLLVLDTAINDRNYYKYGSIRKDQIRAFLEWGVASAAAAGCQVALLLMPSQKAFEKDTISGVIYGKIAAENGILLVDGFQYIRDLSASEGGAIKDYFLDQFHIKKPLAYALGAKLIDRVLGWTERSQSKILPRRFYRLEASAFSGVKITRRSSLLSADFVVIDDLNEAVGFCKPGHNIVGVAFNSTRTGGTLSIKGVGPPVVKSLVTPYSRSERELTLLVTPVVGDCTVSKEGQIRLQIAPAEAALSEVSRFEKTSNENNLTYNSIEIASLLMQAPH